MTLRDYFAGQALTSLLSQMFESGTPMYDPNDPEQAISLAHLSYQAADAMLKARETVAAEPSSDPSVTDAEVETIVSSTLLDENKR